MQDLEQVLCNTLQQISVAGVASAFESAVHVMSPVAVEQESNKDEGAEGGTDQALDLLELGLAEMARLVMLSSRLSSSLEEELSKGAHDPEVAELLRAESAMQQKEVPSACHTSFCAAC